MTKRRGRDPQMGGTRGSGDAARNRAPRTAEFMGESPKAFR